MDTLGRSRRPGGLVIAVVLVLALGSCLPFDIRAIQVSVSPRRVAVEANEDLADFIEDNRDAIDDDPRILIAAFGDEAVRFTVTVRCALRSEEGPLLDAEAEVSLSTTLTTPDRDGYAMFELAEGFAPSLLAAFRQGERTFRCSEATPVHRFQVLLFVGESVPFDRIDILARYTDPSLQERFFPGTAERTTSPLEDATVLEIDVEEADEEYRPPMY